MLNTDVKELEQATFRAAADSGLWDIFLAGVIGTLAVAPFLSVPLGDFWSTAVLLPVWAAIYLVIHVVRVRVVSPRVGTVTFAPPRKRRVKTLLTVALVLNVIAFIAGAVAATRMTPGNVPMLVLLVPLAVTLTGFSLAGYMLGIARLFFYGLLLTGGPFVGEALWRSGHASHHGFPIVLGVSAAVIFVCGLVRFVNFLPRHADAAASEGEGERG